MTLERKDRSMCDGFISRNPVMDSYYLYRFGDFSNNYTKQESIGKTSYFFESYEMTEFIFIDESKTWGYIHNILFSIIGLYADYHEYDENWYHIRIEAML